MEGEKERGPLSRRTRSDSRSRTSFRASHTPGMHRCTFADRAPTVAIDGENELSMSIETIAFLLSFDFWLPRCVHIAVFSTFFFTVICVSDYKSEYID